MSPAGATFSRCRRWRYLLWRCWDKSKPAANFLMLNPSTADEVKLDPSCTRARNYAGRWGYGAVLITNIFAWRETKPGNLFQVKNPVGRGNDAAILKAARESKIVVCAWGNHGLHRERAREVVALLRKEGVRLKFLRINGCGQPAHPLYLPADLKPAPFRVTPAQFPPSPRARATAPGRRG